MFDAWCTKLIHSIFKAAKGANDHGHMRIHIQNSIQFSVVSRRISSFFYFYLMRMARSRNKQNIHFIWTRSEAPASTRFPFGQTFKMLISNKCLLCINSICERKIFCEIVLLLYRHRQRQTNVGIFIHSVSSCEWVSVCVHSVYRLHALYATSHTLKPTIDTRNTISLLWAGGKNQREK